jgi:hypothetical protein
MVLEVWLTYLLLAQVAYSVDTKYQKPTITLFWCDRYGDHKDCAQGQARSSAYASTSLTQPDTSPVTQRLGYYFAYYNFVVPINDAESVSTFWFSLDSGTGQSTVYDNDGSGYELQQDTVLHVPAMGNVDLDGATTKRFYTLTSAVRGRIPKAI